MDSLEQAIRQSESRCRVARSLDSANPFLASPSIFDAPPPWASAVTAADALPTLKTPRFDPNDQRESENRPTVPAPERETLAAPPRTAIRKPAITTPVEPPAPRRRTSALTLFLVACAIIFTMCLVVDRSARQAVFSVAKIALR